MPPTSSNCAARSTASRAISDSPRSTWSARSAGGDAQGRFLTSIDFDESWERQWRRRLYLVDPLPDFALNRPGVFHWSEAFDTPDLKAGQRRYRTFLETMGMADGLGLCCYGPGGRMGFAGFGKPQSKRVFAPFSYLGIAHVAQLSFVKYCMMLQAETCKDVHLSPREREIMRWVANGKSNGDIATILGSWRHTIDTHLPRIFAKLGTTDRSVACLPALNSGYLHAADADFSADYEVGQPTPFVEEG